MTLLVTGATGFVMSVVARHWLESDPGARLVVLDASHLFPIHTTWVGFRRGTLLRNFAYEFMQLFGPHLTRQLIDRAIEARDGDGQLPRIEPAARGRVPVRAESEWSGAAPAVDVRRRSARADSQPQAVRQDAVHPVRISAGRQPQLPCLPGSLGRR